MTECIECGQSVESLYVEFTGEGNIRLTRCPECGNVADKYIEYELVLVVIDIILHRKEAYRHFLFNYQFNNHNQSKSDDFKILYLKRSFVAILINSLLKAIVLIDSISDYSLMSTKLKIFHLLFSS